MMTTDGLAELSVNDIMVRWPSTIAVFLAFGMKCVGCPVGRFHSYAEAMAAHAAPVELMTRAIERAISEDQAKAGPAAGRRR